VLGEPSVRPRSVGVQKLKRLAAEVQRASQIERIMQRKSDVLHLRAISIRR
jgi:hypothetical protein